MAQPIEVTSPGLDLYAANCARHSATVISTAATPPSVPANPAQATALAVGEIHTAVMAHGATLGERIASIARAAFGSAAIYTETEAGQPSQSDRRLDHGRHRLMATLSQVRGWDTTHLHTAANHWDSVAQTWEHSFDAVHQESFAPGGSEWTGEGAESAQFQTAVDCKDALGSVDTLLATATIARNGATEIESAKTNVLDAVANAQNDGFVVGEDFSVTDSKRYPPPVAAARQVQAARHSATITGRVQTLTATDERVAGQMSQGVFAADFPLNRPKPLDPAPPVPPQPQPSPAPSAPQSSPAPPVTGEPIKLPPRTGPPPVAVIDANLPAAPPDQPVDLFPKCSGSRVFWGLHQDLAFVISRVRNSGGLPNKPTPGRSHLLSAAAMLLIAVCAFVDAAIRPDDRYLLVAIGVVLVVTSVVVLFNDRKRASRV